jgi:hypothetical protein
MAALVSQSAPPVNLIRMRPAKLEQQRSDSEPIALSDTHNASKGLLTAPPRFVQDVRVDHGRFHVRMPRDILDRKEVEVVGREDG